MTDSDGPLPAGPPALTTPPPFDQLLSDLRLGTPQQRQQAAVALGKLGNKDEELIITLKTVAKHDFKGKVRDAAQNALVRLGYGEPPSPKRPFYKHWDFWLGFVGWYVINGLIWWRAISYPVGLNNLGFFFYVLPANLIVYLVAASKRRRLAGGMLVAVALNLVIALLLGATMNATCAIPFFIR